METKKCTVCHEIRPIFEFTRDKMKTDGRRSNCKICAAILRRKSYLENIESRREYSRTRYAEDKEGALARYRKYRKSEKGRAYAYAATKKARSKFPEHHLAREAVKYEIKMGRMRREPCVVCGVEQTEAHHEDYSKRLEVIWLCSYHHREHHRKEKVANG